MSVQAASRSGGYLLSRPEKPEPSVDQKILGNEFPFAMRTLFNTFNAAFTTGTTEAYNGDALPGETTSEVKLGMDVAVLPFPVLNFLGMLKEWENAFGRQGELEANRGLMARLELDCLELDAELKSWPKNDPGRRDRQTEIDRKRALCQELAARNNALRALAPRIEGCAATVGSGITPVVVGVNNGVTAVLKVQDQAAEAVQLNELSDVATSTVTGSAIGLVNSICHILRAFPEVNRAMERLDGLTAAEHRLAQAFEDCLSGVEDAQVRQTLDNVVASMIPLVKNMRSQARIFAIDGFFRVVQGASGGSLKSALVAAAVLGPAAPFATGVAIAGVVMGAVWLGWQTFRLAWAQRLRVAAAKIENQLKNDVAIARKSLAADAENPQLSATMTPWLKLIEGCREKGTQGPLTSFLRQAGISESVIGSCQSQKTAAMDLIVPLFSAFKDSLWTATAEVTEERIAALKKSKDPRDVLNGCLLEVENPDCPARPQRNKTLKSVALSNQGNTLTLNDVQRHLSAFKSGKEVDLNGSEGHVAQLLTQYLVDAKDKPGEAQALEETLLTRVNLFIDLSRNNDERAIACLTGRYPGVRGIWKFRPPVVVRETAEAYLRSKYAGPEFEEKLALLAHLAKKNALVRWSSFMEWGKSYQFWQPTEVTKEMAKWLTNPRHVPSAELVRQVFQKHPGVSESERGGAVSFLMMQFADKEWSGEDLSGALNALQECKAGSLFDGWAVEDTERARAAEYALWLRRGLAPGADANLDPVQALQSLHAQHPQVAQTVLDALMGKRFDVPDLSDEVVGQVRAIRDAYGDHFLEGATKGNAVFFIPCKPGPEDSKVLANLVEAARKDARGPENWPSALITASTLPLLKAVQTKARSSSIKRWFGRVFSVIPVISWLTQRFWKKWETESNAIHALGDQLKRNLDSARQKIPESFSPLWTPEYYVGTPVEHAVRTQHLHSIFSEESYDQADSAKCRDIDDTLNLLYDWSRKFPRKREVRRVIAQGGPIQSKTAMHWLLDRQNMLSDEQQTEIRRIAEAMQKKGGSSKPFMNALAVWRKGERSNIVRHGSLEDFLAGPASLSFNDIKAQFQPVVSGIPQSPSAGNLRESERKQPVALRARSRSLDSKELKKITQEIKLRRLSEGSTALNVSSMLEKATQ